jgi:serine/threonine-protein kinase SRPK3
MRQKGHQEAIPAPKSSKNAKKHRNRKKRKDQMKAQLEQLPVGTDAQFPKEGPKVDGEDKLPKPVWSKKDNKKPGKKSEETYESQSEEDYSDTQQERKSEYRKGGYHPVTEGELYNSRYRVVKKLGWGYFSTVWLCWDHGELNFKALKIQKSAQHYREAAQDEITLLTQIRDGDPDNSKCCCRLTDHFEHRGPNGLHVVMVFEVLGENLLELIMKYDYKGIPIPIVKSVTKQLLIAMDYLHRQLQIIHTDVKPENVVVALPQKAVQLVMETYVPPADRHRQLPLSERDPTSLTKSQRKRLRKKLKMQNRGATSKDGGKDGGEEDEDGDKDDKDTDDDEAPKETKPKEPKPNKAKSKEAKPKEEKPEEAKQEEAKPREAKEAAHPAENGVTSPKTQDPQSADVVKASDPKPAGESSVAPAAHPTHEGNGTSEPVPNPEPVVEEAMEEALQRYSHVKLVDFGNACWTHRHFTEEIQTRQYRAPEVIVRNSYNTSADIWSCACLVFELLTGDFLFDPQESEFIDRDEDHLALMVELLQTQPQVPACLYAKGANEFINSQGQLRHINHLKFWDLRSVLHEKYKFTKEKAAEIADFMIPLLAIDPTKRVTAKDALLHPWLEPVPSDWDAHVLGDPNSPSVKHTRGDRGQASEDEWEDEGTDDESPDVVDIPEGMTAEMYRYYLQQQVDLLRLAAHQAAGLQPDSPAEGPGDTESDGPGSPHSDLPHLAAESDTEVSVPPVAEEMSPETSPEESKNEAVD